MAPSLPIAVSFFALSCVVFLPSVSAEGADPIVFPDPSPEAFRALSVLVSLLGVSVLSFCTARRITGFTIDAPPSRWILIATFIDSWIFVFGSALMISGIGLSLNHATCQGAIFLCIVFYASSKVLVYTFLAERVHAVNPGVSRLRSTAYRICLVFLTGYLVVFVLMVWGRISFLRDGTSHFFPYTNVIMDGSDNACVIGLATPASLSLLVYDLILNVLFTCLFLHPLYRSSYRLTPRLRRLARRTLAAAAVALVTSAVNMVVLTIMHGQQLGWVCLGSCGTDVTINALALFFVTNSLDEAASADHAATPLDKRRSGTPTRKPQTGHSPENGLVRSKGMLTNDDPSAVTSQRTILFPGAARTNMSDVSEYEMTDKLDVINPAQTTASILMSNPGSGTNRGMDRIRDTYLGRADTLGGKIQRQYSEKRYHDIAAAVHDSATPRCTTPDGEPTEVHVRTEGPSPRSKARSQPRSVARNRPASATSTRRTPSDCDSEAQEEAPGSGKFVSKVVAMFRSGDKSVQPTSSMIVNVKTLTEEHTDHSQWNTLMVQAGPTFAETGV